MNDELNFTEEELESMADKLLEEASVTDISSQTELELPKPKRKLAKKKEAEETPYASGFAGYKDWVIQDYLRPGFRLELGRGVNPLPVSDFDAIYARTRGILILGALVT